MPEPGTRVLVAAGGTGGHLFPAEALAAALVKRGIAVHLATDVRAARYGGAFSDDMVHVIPSATMRGRDPFSLAGTAVKLGHGLFKARWLLGRLRPAAVIGFGGYPTVPPVLAATWLGTPTLIHDANAVIGRANRFLAPRVTAIATTFPDVFSVTPALAAKATLTGNPVRPAVIAAATIPFPAALGPLHVLVFGGSQGARIMADIVPAAIGRLDTGIRSRLSVVQQAREEDMARVREAYATLTVAAEVAPFFADLPARLAGSHLVVARSGASTVAELSAIGRPVDPGAAAACARSGPVRQCRRAGGRRRGDPPGTERFHPGAASPPRSPRSPASRSGFPPWRQRRNRSAGSTPPSGWPIWC